MRTFIAACLLIAAGCPVSGTTEPEPTPPEPGAFVAGSAMALLPAPVGIGTAGNSPFGAPPSDSPYAGSFPATHTIFGQPSVKAVALSRGEGFEIVLVRTDMIAIVQQLRDAVIAEVRTRTGRDLDDALIWSATHTHSGPGRFIQGDLYSLITDRFFPLWYDRLITTVADTVVAALDDARPAELGFVMSSAHDGHSDRRCEDGVDYQNDALPIVAVRRDGRIDNIVLSYSLHGTVIGMDDETLSRDVSGGIEEKVENLFDGPGLAMLMNGWAADMAPGSPTLPDAVLSDRPGNYERIERVGVYMQEAVAAALPTLAWTSEPTLLSRTVRYPIGRNEIGYGLGEFPYPFGGVYCQGGNDCVTIEPVPDLDESCVAFPETSPAPMQTLTTVGQLGPAHFATWSGECGTLLAEDLIADMRSQDGVGDTIFFGYTNDYLGYALQESDWWYGGYEASGAMWGPRQGDYMRGRIAEAFAAWKGGGTVSWAEPGVPAGFDRTGGDKVVPEDAIEFGTVAAEVAEGYGPTDVVEWEVLGADPWFGNPVARLQTLYGVDWTDVTTVSGRTVDSSTMAFWVELAVDPEWDDAAGFTTPRRFRWRFHFPLAQREPGWPGPQGGVFRFAVALPDGAGGSEEVASAPFTVAMP
jgi:hypothetical protein